MHYPNWTKFTVIKPSLQPVVQEDRTGCGIACVAALAGRKYRTVKTEAEKQGIMVTDARLWSETQPIRKLLARFRLSAGKETGFSSWRALPDLALLAIKWHHEKSGPAWHWVVFVREASGRYVLDSKRSLRAHRRTDFGRIKPKWFLRLSRRKL